VDCVELGNVFLQVLRVIPFQYHSTVSLHTYISPGRWTIGPFVAAVQRHSLTPWT
jgi:hypothetical protein